MTTNSTKSPANKPIFRKSLPGGISTAVFENHHEGRTYRSVNLQRSYRKNGQWVRSSMYLDHELIPFAIELLQGTLDFLNTGYGATANAAEATEVSPGLEEFDEVALENVV